MAPSTFGCVDFNQPPVVQISFDPERAPAADEWPMTIPAIAQLAREGLELSPGVTFLVGENGSGKSTIVEAAAVAYGLSPEGGTPFGQHSTHVTESPLAAALTLRRGIGTKRWGFFLRSETMHGWYSFVEDRRDHHTRDPNYHKMSHGESFLEVLRMRFNEPGFYCLDEPEAALSFSSMLGLISVLQNVVDQGGQVLCATHSPVLAAMPGATLLEVGDWGLRRTTWDELELVYHWRAYLESPQRYLRHVLD